MKELPVNQVLCGDCIEVMKGFPEQSIDVVMFSPPYWGLRDYGKVEQVFGDNYCEHEWVSEERRLHGGSSQSDLGAIKRGAQKSDWVAKDNFCVKCGAWRGQFGLEPHPNLYIEHMVELCREVKRVLKKQGSLYIVVGDTYCSMKGKCFNAGGGSTSLPQPAFKELTEDRNPNRMLKSDGGWLQPKQLLLMPSRLAIALQGDGWILRNDIVWHKPNHMPSSVKDRLTNSWEHIFHLVKVRRYFYDLDAIRKPHKGKPSGNVKRKENLQPERSHFGTSVPWNPTKKGKNPADVIKIGMHHGSSVTKGRATHYEGQLIESDPKGKNPGDVVRGTPAGPPHHAPRFRPSDFGAESLGYTAGMHVLGKNPGDFWSINTKPFKGAHFAVYPEKICEVPIKASCPKDGIVLDPMCGSGTTLVVAHKLGRTWIGIELNPDYVKLAKKRLESVGAFSSQLDKYALYGGKPQ